MPPKAEPPRAQPPLDVWADLLDGTELSPQAKAVARARVVTFATALRRRVHRLHWLYRAGRSAVTLGALLMPALTGLDSQRAVPEATFWLVWLLGLSTGASNAFLSLFGVDRKYFLLKEQLVRLESEAWLFLSLSGRYRAGEGHQGQMQAFVEKCELILDRATRVQDGEQGKASPPNAASNDPTPPGREQESPSPASVRE